MKKINIKSIKDLKNKKAIISISIISLLIIVFSIVSFQTHSSKILKGVKIVNIDVGGLTKDEAKNKLLKSENIKGFKLMLENDRWYIPYNDAGITIYIDEIVDSAYSYNKKSGFFSNFIRTIGGDFGNTTKIPMLFNVKADALNSTLENIKNKIDSSKQNASVTYVDGKVEKIPSKDGIELNTSKTYTKILNNLKNSVFSTELIVTKTKPTVIEEDLKSIDTLLGSYSTVFGGMANRSYNIIKSAQDSNGILLKQGDEFSFNKLTGEKTLENGYKNAPVIESGKLVLGTGGGVCQTSSTIFNAALYAGMEIVDRRSHTIPSDYVNLGRDATVFDGSPGQDFVFRNPFKSPVYVKNFVSGNKLISQIFGSKDDEKKIKIITQTIAVKKNGVKTLADPSLPAGKKVIESYSRPTIQVVTYRLYLDDAGNVEKREKIGYSIYPGKEGVVRVGAGGVVPTQNTGAANMSTNGTSSINGTNRQKIGIHNRKYTVNNRKNY